MIQGINFGGDGPIMQGTWYNPYTGDAFTVRDAFFEDNQYIVMTTDGRKMDYNRLQNYVQSDMKLEDLKKMKIEKTEKDEIPDEIKNILATNDDMNNEYLIPEDNIYTSKPLGNINTPRHIAPASVHMHAIDKPINVNTTIIEKALKNTTKPSFRVDVSWVDYPERQIEMLKDVMDIPEDEILDWYLDNISMLEIVEAVKEGIRTRILFKEGIIEGIITESTPTDTTAEIPTVVEGNPIVKVENTPVDKKQATTKKVTTKNTVKKPAVKKSQPKKS